MSLASRIHNLFRRNRVEDDIQAELAAHLAMRVEDNLAAGMAPQQARRDARLRFGNPTVVSECTTEADAALYAEGLWADARYTLRQLTRSPGFALTAVLTLALGIGANLAVFLFLHAVLFAHLPVPQPDQLYTVHAAKTPFDGTWSVSYPAYRRLRESASGSAPVAAHSWIGQGVLQESNTSSRVDYQLISDNFFSVLNLTPYAGRFFLPQEDASSQPEWPVILRYSFFQQHFGADPSILGRRATVNGIPIVVVGIAPKGFSGVLQWNAPDLWLPLAAQSTIRFGTAFDSLGPGFAVDLDKPWLAQPTIFWLWPIARVPAPVKTAVAAQWTATLAPDLAIVASENKDPQQRARIQASQVELVSAANGEGNLRRRYSLPLILLMAMAAAILLVGFLNLANLQMARLLQRVREIAIRIALGASRSRVMRQVAMEAFVLVAIGGVAAFLTSRIASALLLAWASGRGRPMNLDLALSPSAFLTGAALLALALLGFGILPVWQITRRAHAPAQHSLHGTRSGQTRRARRGSDLLLAAQVGFSLLLLSAAALFTQTLRNITHMDTGMDSEHILSVHVDMRSTGFAAQQQNLPVLFNRILDRIQSLPSVTSAAVSMCDIPQCGWNTILHVFGHPELPESALHGQENHVGPGYFRTLGIPLIDGRDFSTQDTETSQRVAILNRSYAHQLFGNANPIGQWIGYNAPPGDHRLLIVGLVADARVDGLRNPAPPFAYLSNDQNPEAIGTIEVRFRGALHSLPDEIRAALRDIAPTLPITEITPLSLELQDGLTTEQLLARLTAVFGALALALAALGFYGLASFRVARKTSEIGLRMALGATRARIQAHFLRQTLLILLAGVLPGIALTVATGYAARKLLYGSGIMSLSALAFATAVLAVVGILATLLPARRAASVHPVEALRSE